jgi:hypothetical protein
MASNKTNWKHFFLSSLKGNKPVNADNLYVNTRRHHQKGGQINEPIKLITPTMQVTDQARQSLHTPDQFNHLKKRKRKYRKNKTVKRTTRKTNRKKRKKTVSKKKNKSKKK